MQRRLHAHSEPWCIASDTPHVQHVADVGLMMNLITPQPEHQDPSLPQLLHGLELYLTNIVIVIKKSSNQAT
jgi:hypothetical protein